MADDKSKKGGADRGKVSQQSYEIDHVARKHHVNPDLVRKIQKEVGPSREAIEKELKRRGN